MTEITNFLSNIDLNSLITIFDIQIALAIVVIAFLVKGVVARIIIGTVYKFSKNTKKARESEMYAPIKKMFVILSIYIALRIIPKGERMTYIINEIFKVILILFVAKFITTFIHSDSKYLKRFFKKPETYKVNELFCKILRGFIWVIAFFVITNELGYADQINTLVAGLGFVSAIFALAAQELVKNLLSRSFNSYRQTI